jgi:hypothetical protein
MPTACALPVAMRALCSLRQHRSATALRHMERFTHWLEFGIAKWMGYDPYEERARQKLSASLVLFGSTAVAGWSTAVLLYKLGYVQPLLPAAVLKPIDDLAATVGALTEPPASTTKGFRGATQHMLQVYGATAGLFLASFAGTKAFFRLPYLPIPAALALTAVPSFVILCVPPHEVNRRSRRALALVGSFGCGYVFGPLNWVAADAMAHVAVSVTASLVGFSGAAVITRGRVSYFVVSQLLASSLSICGSHALMGRLSAHRGDTSALRLAQMEVANGMLMLQLAGNLALVVLHSLPTMWRFHARRAEMEAAYPDLCKDGAEVATAADDEEDRIISEAFVIFGSAAYATWFAFRVVCMALLRRMGFGPAARAVPNMTAQQRDLAEASMRRIDRAGDVVSSVLFLWLYMRVVASMQQRGAVMHLNNGRWFLQKLAPSFRLVA